MVEHVSSKWVSPEFKQTLPLMRMAEHLSREWVIFPCLSRSEPLMRMAKCVSSKWVPLRYLSRLTWLIKMAEQVVSWSPVFENHWWEWLNMCPGCELISSIWRNQDHWPEWLNMHPESESLFNFLADKNYLQKIIEHVSSLWVALQCLSISELLMRMAEYASRM